MPRRGPYGGEAVAGIVAERNRRWNIARSLDLVPGNVCFGHIALAVRFDAESLDTLTFQGHQFPYMAGVRTNELAYKLVEGNLKYPATVFLSAKGEVLQDLHGYIQADTMAKVLRYFGEDHYKTNDWDIFMNRY